MGKYKPLLFIIIPLLTLSFAISVIEALAITNINITLPYNCSIYGSFNACPSLGVNQESVYNYIRGDYVDLSANLANSCKNESLEDVTLWIINQNNRSQRKSIQFNLSSQADINNISWSVKNEEESMNYSFFLDIPGSYIEPSPIFSLNWTATSLNYHVLDWKRTLNFDFPLKITDEIDIILSPEVTQMSLSYPLEGTDLNFLHVFDCTDNKESCTTTLDYSNGTTLFIKLQNNTKHHIKIDYALEKTIDIRPFRFPFDEVKSNKIFFPESVSLLYSSEKSELVRYAKISFFITEPRGFSFNQKKSEDLTSKIFLSTNNTHDLIIKNGVNNKGFTLNIITYPLRTVRSSTSPNGDPEGIVYYGSLDEVEDLKEIRLLFDRPFVYQLIFISFILLSLIYFCLILRYGREQFMKYLEISLISIFGILITLPIPLRFNLFYLIIIISLILSGIFLIINVYVRHKDKHNFRRGC
ncbi:Uncharacterised protein [uncultured archaeon]|nr:Uncharacterised protein [uncultured archaeon]